MGRVGLRKVPRSDREVVALLPAAGRSRRLGPLPCSKELIPVGFRPIAGLPEARPKVASHYLLECIRRAGIRKAYIVIRQGKWDIPAYWGDGKMLDMDLAYLVIDGSHGPPDTIDRAYPFVREKIVAFGFPDILFRPNDVFVKLLARLHRSDADVVLGLFPAHDARAMDMVDIDKNNRVHAIQLKPGTTRLKYAWLTAVWSPAFSEFLHDFLRTTGIREKILGNRRIDPQGDIPVGAVLRAAIRAKLKVEGVVFQTGHYIDIGTPKALALAIRGVF
jgi:glucose-1-phosphate thymidylyltransferase